VSDNNAAQFKENREHQTFSDQHSLGLSDTRPSDLRTFRPTDLQTPDPELPHNSRLTQFTGKYRQFTD